MEDESRRREEEGSRREEEGWRREEEESWRREDGCSRMVDVGRVLEGSFDGIRM